MEAWLDIWKTILLTDGRTTQSWVISPQVHRIHHSRLPEHRDRNFAQYFPVIDRVFGSFYAPRRNEFPPTGAQGLASNASIFTAMIRPVYVWASLFSSKK